MTLDIKQQMKFSVVLPVSQEYTMTRAVTPLSGQEGASDYEVVTFTLDFPAPAE